VRKIRCLFGKNRGADFQRSNEIVCVMNLKKIKNIALTISLISFAVGFSGGGESMFWYMGRPVGAILFAVFMIFKVLEKETALLDEQQRAAKREIEKSFSDTSVPHKRPTKEHCAPALTKAISHCPLEN
jgi:hypothetical protein